MSRWTIFRGIPEVKVKQKQSKAGNGMHDLERKGDLFEARHQRCDGAGRLIIGNTSGTDGRLPYNSGPGARYCQFGPICGRLP
jgi:hypothetical protein